MLKKVKIALPIIFVLVLVFIVILNRQPPASKDLMMENVLENKDKYLALSDSIERYLDTGFYAEYRLGKLDFVFYYLRNDSIADFFEINQPSKNKLFKQLYSLGIKKIWKYNSENFYRYVFYVDRVTRPQLLILSTKATSFAIPEDSRINSAKIVNSITELNEVTGSKLYKISPRCWFFYPSKD